MWILITFFFFFSCCCPSPREAAMTWRSRVSLWVIKLLWGTQRCWMKRRKKKKLLMELANCNCFMWQTVIIQAKEGKRERVWVGWRKNNRGTWPPHTAIRAVLGCDERWQLALLWADTVPFFGPQGATSAAQTLSLQLPWPPESPPQQAGLSLPFAAASPWDS